MSILSITNYNYVIIQHYLAEDIVPLEITFRLDYNVSHGHLTISTVKQSYYVYCDLEVLATVVGH